jgi:hypothetical protein
MALMDAGSGDIVAVLRETMGDSSVLPCAVEEGGVEWSPQRLEK